MLFSVDDGVAFIFELNWLSVLDRVLCVLEPVNCSASVKDLRVVELLCLDVGEVGFNLHLELI